MRYEFFASSYKTWQAMYEDIRAARESVYLETYIFLDDLHNFNFLKLLGDKAREGVRVRIILDAWGSLGLSRTAIEELRESGAEVFFYSNLLHRIHRKILILDERVAYIGGVNFHQVALKWADLTLRFRGKLVESALRSFAKVYAECGGRDSRILAHRRKIILDKTRASIIEHFPGQKKATLKKIYKQALGQADKEIILVTPYLLPRRWFVRALHQTALRGVQVEVLVPKNSNHLVANAIGRFFMYRLSLSGVKFYLEPRMNHAKCMLIDGKEGLVGSNNLDFFSFDLNSEVGVFLKEPSAVAKLKDIIHHWKKDTELFDPALYKPKFLDHVLAPIVHIFSILF